MERVTIAGGDTKPAAERYGLAILAGVLALIARQALTPLLGNSNPFHTAWAAVVFASWYCGLFSSILTVLINVLGVWYWFLPLRRSFEFQNPRTDIPSLVGFVLFSGFIVALGEANRRSKARMQREIAERNRTETELRETERQLNEAQRLSGIGSWTMDVGTGAVHWSEGLYRISGRDPKLPPPAMAASASLFSPESWLRIQAAIEATLKTGEGFDAELKLIRGDGAVVDIMTHAEAQRDAAGRVVKLFGSMQDISEGKRAERALRDNEERLRIAQRAGHSGTYERNFQTGETFSSSELRELYGFAADDIVEREQWRRCVHPDDLGKHDEAVARVIQERGTDCRTEFRIIRLDGALRWIEATAKILYSQTWQPLRYVAVCTDITERKQAHEALRENEERLRIAYRAAHSGAWEVDLKTKEIMWSPEMQALWGLVPGTVTDIRGQIRRMILEEDYGVVDKALADALEGEDYHLKFRITRADGAVRWMESFGEMIRDENNAPARMVGVVIDITERKHAEEALLKSHLELEHKVAERTQALVAVLANLEMEVGVRAKNEEALRELSARLLTLQDDERRRIARDLHDSVGQTVVALKMTLAALGNMVADAPQALKIIADLDLLAGQALQEIRTTSHLLHPPMLDEIGFSSAAQWYVDGFANRSGIDTSLEVLAKPHLTKRAETVLFRVLQECLTNVHRHARSKSAHVCLDADEDNAVLSIRDHGVGIPAEKLQGFQQTGTGMGVGLRGMRQRVNELGGQVKIDCDGAGTCVKVTLPLQKNVASAVVRDQLARQPIAAT